jgi:hypothetical protein
MREWVHGPFGQLWYLGQAWPAVYTVQAPVGE